MSRAKKQAVCKTPGAFWFFKMEAPRHINFSVSMPREVLDAIDEKRAARLEKAFHDAIEPILGPIWKKEP